MQVALPPIIRTEVKYPLPTKAVALEYITWAAGTIAATAGIYYGQTALEAAGLALVAAFAAVHGVQRINDYYTPIEREAVDVKAIAVVSPNMIQMQRSAGGDAFFVQIAETKPLGESEFQKIAMQKLNEKLDKGICELANIPHNLKAGEVLNCTVQIRSVQPDKNGHHSHSDVAHHMISKGWLSVENSAICQQRYLSALTNARRASKGYWGTVR